jgi:hypothetical protein
VKVRAPAKRRSYVDLEHGVICVERSSDGHNGFVFYSRPGRSLLVDGDDAVGAGGLGAGRAHADHAPRVQALLYLADDRRRGQREGFSTHLGHSSIIVTLDRYGHPMPGNEHQAGALIEDYLGRRAPLRGPSPAARS